ncbi:MAG: immunoglobulin domain-containing protein [Rubrivivax sp.]|nr:immunoglobulin domain-containing protein [Rubrivivax sp.]
MRADTPVPRHLTWRRLAWLGIITVVGLAAIVGSGGGAVGFPPCGPPLCGGGPLPPPAVVRLMPADVTAQVGASATFVAEVQNIDAPSYRWRRSNDGGTTYTELPGATGNRLTLTAVNLGDHGARLQVQVSSGGVLYAQASGQLYVSATPGIVFTDGEFLPADWTFSPVLGPAPAPAASSAERVATGGNPDAWWRMQVQVPAGAGSTRLSFLSTAAVYDPRQQGAIAAIDYAEDCNAVLASDTAYTESWLALEQAGRHYVANARGSIPICVLAGWRPVASLGRLVERDFTFVAGPACVAGEACPDFAAAALPLRFGFARQSYAAPGQTVPHGIDNWRVTVWRR